MQVAPIFRDRFDAGRRLAERLAGLVQDPESLVLALPRGGVPVGFEVARAWHVGPDIFLVRKLGLPGHEELAIGAIASGGVRVLNEDLVKELQLSGATTPFIAVGIWCEDFSQTTDEEVQQLLELAEQQATIPRD
jgi:putative phosphoribosyl transferase